METLTGAGTHHLVALRKPGRLYKHPGHRIVGRIVQERNGIREALRSGTAWPGPGRPAGRTAAAIYRP